MQQQKTERYIHRFLFLILFSSFAILADEENSQKKSVLDETHDGISSVILNITRGIDDYFSNGKYKTLINQSQLKLSMLMKIKESADPSYEPDINFRLMLPRTQKRLQLVIEPSDSDERSETSDSQQERRRNRNRDTTNAGLRYKLDLTGTKFSTGTGVILGLTTKYFLRFTAKKEIKLSDWRFKVKEELYWINSDGLSSELDADFHKHLNENFELKLVNNISWDETNEIIEFENGPTLFQNLGKSRRIAYHAHVFTVNKPEITISNYLLQFTYTQTIFKSWIYANLSPFLNFPRENRFHRTPGFHIRIDALFGYF